MVVEAAAILVLSVRKVTVEEAVVIITDLAMEAIRRHTEAMVVRVDHMATGSRPVITAAITGAVDMGSRRINLQAAHR